MSPDDRRAHILDAVVPLIMAHGADVTTSQIAEAAGIAEGTIFRAFADKDELINAAVARFMDPMPAFAAAEEIDPQAPLEHKVRALVAIIRERSEGAVGIMAALGHRKVEHDREHHRKHAEVEARAIAVFSRLFAADEAAMRVDRELAVLFIRLLTFGAAMPMFTARRDITNDEIVDFVMRGIVKEGN